MKKKRRAREKEGEGEKERKSRTENATCISKRYGSLFLLFRWSPVARAQPVNIKGCLHVSAATLCSRIAPRLAYVGASSSIVLEHLNSLLSLVGKMDISRKSTHSNADRDYLS